VSGVEVTATHRDGGGSAFGYIARAETDDQGRFAIDRAVALSGASAADVSERLIRLEFRHKNHAHAQLEDLQILGRETRTDLSIMLQDGRSIEGRVVDAERQPVKGALVESTFGERYELRRGTISDANGGFELRGLPALAGEIRVLTTEPGQAMLTGRQKLDRRQRDTGEIVLTVIRLPPDLTVHELLGMKLIDVDATIQRLFHLPRVGGVLVLDPGVNSERLNIGPIRRGDQFWIVGDQPVEDFNDFKTRLSDVARSGGRGVRVVYNFSRTDRAGTMTKHLELNDADIAAVSQ
jgi:hypothetical protein